MSDTVIESKTTETQYDEWHRRLEGPTWEVEDARPGVLISEILGPEDGPHEGDR